MRGYYSGYLGGLGRVSGKPHNANTRQPAHTSVLMRTVHARIGLPGAQDSCAVGRVAYESRITTFI